MSFSTILFNKYKNNIGVVTLNRPHRMNSVTEEMYSELLDVFNQMEKDKDVRVVVLKGSPLEKNGMIKYSFCAGADLKKHGEGTRDYAAKQKYIRLAHTFNERIYKFGKPVIACVNGHARGAGLEMALCCDFIFMADEATIAFPETSLGTFVGGGVSYILPRIVGMEKAKYLIFSGAVLSGRDAVKNDIAIYSFPINQLEGEVIKFADILKDKAPLSISFAKSILNRSLTLDYKTVLDLEADCILQCMTTSDWEEGIKAFIEKRKPEFKGD